MRIVKPGFFTNEELAELPPLTRILFIGLWTIADRRGRLEDRPKKIKVELLPYDELNVDASLTELHKSDFITRYVIDGKNYIQINKFEKHQHCHVKEQESTIPAPCKTGANTSLTGTVTITGTEHKEHVSRTKNMFVPPSIEEIQAYCTEKGYLTIDAEKFHAYYESNGWKVGKNPMRSWHAAITTWRKNDSGGTNGLQVSAGQRPGRDFGAERDETRRENAREALRQRRACAESSLGNPGPNPYDLEPGRKPSMDREIIESSCMETFEDK